MSKYVIVGNGVAGTTAAEHIRKHDENGSIVVLSSETFPFYYRVRLIDFLAGDVDEQGLAAHNEDWYKERGIEVKLGVNVTSGDAEKRIVTTQDGEVYEYDRLLIATGSHSLCLP